MIDFCEVWYLVTTLARRDITGTSTKGKEGMEVPKDMGTDGGQEEEEESIQENAREEVGRERTKVDSELISDDVALVHLMKGNIGIGVMAMPR